MNILRLFLLGVLLSCVLAVTADTPVGHLQVLGSHRPPSIDIDEFTLDNAPKPEAFYRDYVRNGKAAIFRGAVLGSKGFNLWTDEYIRENYGELEARIEGKKEKGGGIPVGETYIGRDTLRHFVDTYHNSSSYMVSELPQQMFKEVGIIPSVGACGLMAKRFVEIDIWWNGGGGKSIIHKDAFNQINCLFRGTKQWKLFEYKYEKWIYKHVEREDAIGGFSDVNVDAVDLIKHKDFAKIPWSNITIYAGDCLYLPKSYYHQVYSEGTNNLAVSILFSRMDGLDEIDVSDCNDKTDYKAIKHLDEFDVMWKWNGSGYMSMGRGDLVYGHQQDLIENINDFGEDLTVDMLSESQGLIAGQAPKEKFPDLEARNISRAFELLDLNGNGRLSVEEVEGATWDALRYYGLQIEEYEPSNSYIFEYSLIPYEKVRWLVTECFKRYEKLTRAKWVKLYVKNLKGTEHYANIVFDGLAGSADVVVASDVT
uniref:JmjC domain-containing protein n=2 Tax=Ciona intestinalis TaxID=7719 RepID=F6Z3G2_CIOIN